MRTRALLAVAAVTATAALTGCTADKAPAPVRQSSAAPTPTAPAVADTSCKPTASLRPTGALPEPGKMPAGSYMEQIQKRGKLVLGTSKDTLLFSSRDPSTGKVVGFDIDMGRQIAQAIFGDPNKIQIKVIGNDQRVPDVVDGTVDLVAETMTATCDRWKLVNFSTIYYDAGQKVLVSSTSKATRIEDLGGKKVCAANGSTSLVNLSAVATKPIPVGRPTFGDCLVAFQQNEVDAVSTDDAILAGMAAQDPYAKVVGQRFSSEPYGLASSQSHPEFTQFSNAVLEKMRADGTWAATYRRWLGASVPQPPVAEYK